MKRPRAGCVKPHKQAYLIRAKNQDLHPNQRDSSTLRNKKHLATMPENIQIRPKKSYMTCKKVINKK